MATHDIIKNQATSLQENLAAVGVALTRAKAIEVTSRMHGYRSYNAARHGAPHKPELHNGKCLTLKVVTDYVAAAGAHCPYCGAHDVHDAHNAYSDVALWDLYVGCRTCQRHWWAAYRLDSLDGLRITEQQKAWYVKREGSSCPHCQDTNLEYGAFIGGARAYQFVKCKSCLADWVDLYRLDGLAEATSPF